jgi:hypothetical protein
VPLQDIFWTSLFFFGFALAIWLVFLVLRDVFERPDLSGGAKVGWTVFACVFPIFGPIIYIVMRGPSAGELWTGSEARRRRAGIYE